jgi:hypothetical protein
MPEFDVANLDQVLMEAFEGFANQTVEVHCRHQPPIIGVLETVVSAHYGGGIDMIRIRVHLPHRPGPVADEDLLVLVPWHEVTSIEIKVEHG